MSTFNKCTTKKLLEKLMQGEFRMLSVHLPCIVCSHHSLEKFMPLARKLLHAFLVSYMFGNELIHVSIAAHLA